MLRRNERLQVGPARIGVALMMHLLGLLISSRPGDGSRDIHAVSATDTPDGLRPRRGSPIYTATTGDAKPRFGEANEDEAREEEIFLCLLMIVRDEETNLRANLPLWDDVVSCYVFGVDDRTTDGTVQAIREVLPQEKPRFVFFYSFEDFAQARNAVLRSTSHNFPSASHVLIADADWRPQQETLNLSDLDFDHGTFQFRIWDHSGHTTRLAGWLLRNDPGLKFKYRVHETLDTSAASSAPSKVIKWQVTVVESNSSWHATEHGHSRTAERFLFDMDLLELDYKDDPTDLHTLFYLGITTYSYMETLIGKGTHEKTPELERLIDSGMSYLRQAVDLYGDQEGLEFVWSSIRWMAYGYHYFVGDAAEAEMWYRKCIDYDATRVDCEVFLSRLFLDNGDLDSAWESAKIGLLYTNPMHRPMDYFYIFECFVPMQAAKVISARAVTDSLGGDSLHGILTLGWYLMRHHRDHCNHGVLVDTPDDLDKLESWFEETIKQEGVDPAETKRLALLSPDASLLSVLLEKWGTGLSALHPVQARDGRGHDTTSSTANPEASSPSRSGLELAGIEDKGSKETPGLTTVADVECSSLVQQTRILSDFPGGDGAERVLAASNLAQIEAVMTAPLATRARYSTHPFRALVFGGEDGSGSGHRKEGLENEELLQLFSLLLQLASSPIRFQVTYAASNERILEASRAATARCLAGLGIPQDSLRFVHSNRHGFLDTSTDEVFDYVDLGGPLSAGRKHHRNEGHQLNRGTMGERALDGETLRRLREKLAPGACLRMWAFAANPSTELVFRAAAKKKAAAADAAAASMETSTARSAGDGLLADVVRKVFGVRQESVFPGCGGVAGRFRSGTDTTEEAVVSPARFSPGRRETQVAEEAWVGRILAGGDRLRIAEIDNILSDDGFELTLILSRCGQAERVGDLNGVLEHAAEMLAEDLSRWEAVDIADSLQPYPVLVHQVLAVWRGNASNSTAK